MISTWRPKQVPIETIGITRQEGLPVSRRSLESVKAEAAEPESKRVRSASLRGALREKQSAKQESQQVNKLKARRAVVQTE